MSISENIQHIQTLFLEGKNIGLKIQSLDEIILEDKSQSDVHFAVFYEGVSMGLFINNRTIWVEFCEKNKELYGSQIYVGVGWAFGELAELDYKFLESLSPIWRWRVLDGYGYYCGLFKRREAIRQQLIPENLADDDIHAFNQGIGRSLWYLTQGDHERLLRMISIFPEERKASFWRGIGLAMTYVGGFSQNQLNLLIASSDSFLPSLKCGVVLAAASIEKGEILHSDAEKITSTLAINKLIYEKVFSESISYSQSLNQITDSLS